MEGVDLSKLKRKRPSLLDAWEETTSRVALVTTTTATSKCTRSRSGSPHHALPHTKVTQRSQRRSTGSCATTRRDSEGTCVFPPQKRNSSGSCGLLRGVRRASGDIDFTVPVRRVSGPAMLDRRCSSFESSVSVSVSRRDSSSTSGSQHTLVTRDRRGSAGDVITAVTLSTDDKDDWRTRVRAFGSRMGSFFKKLGPTRAATSVGGRVLRLEDKRSGGQRRASGGETWEELQGSGPPIRNESTSLVVRSLLDGMISAEFPLDGVPQGELAVKVRGNKVVLLTRPLAGKSATPTPYCFLELPIFVEPSSLDFELNAEPKDILIIRGLLKSATCRRQSASLQVGTLKKSASQPLLTITANNSRKFSYASHDTSTVQCQPKRSSRANSH